MTSVSLANRACRLLIAPLVSLMFAGCSLMDESPESPFAFLQDEPEYVTPQKVIPVWSDTVLHQTGQPGVRGCGGRILFYGINEKEAVQVDGTLIVYAWDDTSESVNRKPDRKYVFRAEEFQDHYSRSKVGHSYSVWIPWDNAGGSRRQLTLVARFIGRNGAEVQSTPAKVILAGPVSMPEKPVAAGTDTSTAEPASDAETGVRLAAFEEMKQQTSDPNRRTRMTTSSAIEMTDGFLTQSLSRVPPKTDRDGFTAEELFGNESASDAAVEVSEEPTGEDAAAPENRDAQHAPDSIAPPESRSSRFPPRVQMTREARRSVGRVQSERSP